MPYEEPNLERRDQFEALLLNSEGETVNTIPFRGFFNYQKMLKHMEILHARSKSRPSILIQRIRENSIDDIEDHFGTHGVKIIPHFDRFEGWEFVVRSAPIETRVGCLRDAISTVGYWIDKERF